MRSVNARSTLGADSSPIRLRSPQLESIGTLAQPAASNATATMAPYFHKRLNETTIFAAPELRDGVITAGVEWMASSDTLGSHPTPFDHAIFLNRLIGIDRTGWLETARRGQGWRDKPLVKANERQ